MSEKEFLLHLKQNQRIIYKLVNLYATSDEDKKDLYQEIIFQAWKAYPNFRGDAKFSTWLYQLSLNTILSLKRKTNRVEYTDTAKYEQRYVTDSNSDDSARLYAAIRTLPEIERAIVSLHLEGYDHQEISDLLGITSNLVGVKLYRIRKQLSTLLKNI